jgi:hypothetical protein
MSPSMEMVISRGHLRRGLWKIFRNMPAFTSFRPELSDTVEFWGSTYDITWPLSKPGGSKPVTTYNRDVDRDKRERERSRAKMAQRTKARVLPNLISDSKRRHYRSRY